MRQHYLIYRNRLLAVTWRSPSSSVVIKITSVGLLPHVSPTYKIWGTSVSFMTDLLYKILLGTCQKLGGGERRWKTGEGRSFLSPSKGKVMKKMTGKEGGSQKNKPPRSWKDALIYIMFYKNTNHLRESWHAIISWHTVQPPLSGHSHLLAIPMRVLFVVTSSSHALSGWYTYFGFISRIRWRKIQSEIEVDTYGPMRSASWLLAGVQWFS